MFGFLGFFRLVFFVYIGAAVLIIAVGYDYIDKNHPKIDLPYEQQVFGLRDIIVKRLDSFIKDENSSKIKKKANFQNAE